MRAVIGDFETDIYLEKSEALEHCRPGEGPETCVWLLCGSQGWQCSAYHKPWALVERHRRGETSAKREGDLTGCPIPPSVWKS